MKLRKNVIDETGNVYGKLTVLYPVRPEGCRKIMWHCKCECGNEKDFYGSDLRSGKRTSCGNYCNSIKEEVGKTYGFLKVLSKDERPPKEFPDKSVHFICKCELCGTIASISGRLLRNGEAKSCGCAESLGEQYIAKALQDLNFEYQKEFKFDDLKGDTGIPLRFDFLVNCPQLNNYFLIEFQGNQHFEEVDYFRDNYETRLKNDKKKKDFCISNKINILYFNQKSSRKFNGDFEQFKEVILNYYKLLEKGEKGYEIFDYSY